jgi:phosphoglycolate phosphatase
MILIWDFNGTLLDDAQVCIDCMNIMLKERELPELDLARYREIFTFPVRNYYSSLGFDFQKEPFEIPAHRFIDLYREAMYLAPLQKGAIEMLEHFKNLGYQQIILSAMEQDFLLETIDSKGILGYFDRVTGITNHLADGKLDMAKELVGSLSKGPGEIVMIGDTIHDFEVATGSGIPVILIARGHQSFRRLKALDCSVFEELTDLKEVFGKS